MNKQACVQAFISKNMESSKAWFLSWQSTQSKAELECL